MAPTGEARKTVTVVFCDVTGSTALGEQLDPESLRAVIQQYFVEMRAVVERHGGIVEKFIGDAVMAVFGVPRVHEDDALRAVRAAADMQTALADVNERFQHDFGVRIEARIGVNTGEVIAGDPGAGESFVSGDTVNTAARLEQAAEPGGILLGKSTYRLVRAAVIAEPLTPLDAKGKADPLAAFRLVVVEPRAEMLPRRLDAPLVGRATELAELRRAFDDAVSNSACRIVTLLGEAGVGKSRLAHELLGAVEGEARVLRGRCLPYGEGITFWPVTEILEEAAGVHSGGEPDDVRSKISRLLPEEHASLGDHLGTILGLGGASGSIQETFLAVRRCLEHLAKERPLVVVFDDIHWAEDKFLDLVQYLTTFIRGSAVLLVCLARPELLESRPDWSQLGPILRLRPLDASHSEAMVANLLGGGVDSDEIAATIGRAAAGNPLFIEETVRMLVDQGLVAREGDRWNVTCEMSELVAPDTVHSVIAARLDRLEPAERAILQSAAVVGEVFWWGAVADLADEGAVSGVGGGLQALVRKDLIRPDPSSFFGEDAFRFGHLLIRDVAYDSLPKRARAGLHDRFSRWVDARAGGRTAEYDEIVGYHAERAHQYLRELAPADEHSNALAVSAAERLGAAGQRSFQRHDMIAAASLLSRAAALRRDDDPLKPVLLKDLADALSASAQLDDADRVFSEAATLARSLGNEGLALRAEIGLKYLRFHRTADITQGDFLAVLADASARFAELGEDDARAELLQLRGVVHVWAGQCATALEVFEEALERAERSGDERTATEVRHWICLALAEGPTPVDEAAATIQGFLAAPGVGRTFEAESTRYLAELRAMQGRFDEARSLMAQTLEFARDLGLDLEVASGHMRNAAVISVLEGNLELAEASMRRSVEALVEADDKGHLASCAPELAGILLAMGGRDREALEMAELGESSSIDEDVDAQVRWRATKAQALVRLGQAEEAEPLARSAVDRAWRTDYAKLRALSHEGLAEVLLRTGRGAEAVASMEIAVSVYESKGNVMGAEAARRKLSEMRASGSLDRS